VRWALTLAVALVFVAVSYGNDGAASTAAGGIQLKREARISMEKERLFISEKKITVEYEFLNETDRDITTEVAFPVPPYDQMFLDSNTRLVDNFRVWIEGHEIKYQSEVKAMLGNVDYSTRLRQLGVDIVSLGHFDDVSPGESFSRDFGKLSKQQQNELRRIGLFNEYFPLWTVVMTHHWQQTFPAHRILHVRHEYTPVIGEEVTVLDDLINKKPVTRHGVTFAQWCIDAPLRNALTTSMRKTDSTSFVKWVDYILTTANTWKKPIKRFELVVERPRPDVDAKDYYVSFCWDGQVLQPDPDHFVARATNFIPKKELSVAFFPRE
jgi:hypothetical protein